MKLTIITPTYNRKNNLRKCYESLKNQTMTCFKWLIIDDGSMDATDQLVKEWSKKSNPFFIEYHYKKNGGKHTALNYSHPFIDSELIMILDSDDYLLPDAVETICYDWEKYKNNKKISGITYLRGKTKDQPLAEKFPDNEIVSNSVYYRNKYNLKGDYCEIIRTECFKSYKFPEFEGERFLTEGCLWNTLAEKYLMVFRNSIIYICEYLDGGLTKTGRMLRISNPQGGLYQASIQLKKFYPLKIRIKSAWAFIAYSKFAGKFSLKSLILNKNAILLLFNLPFGLLTYEIWKVLVNEREKK